MQLRLWRVLSIDESVDAGDGQWDSEKSKDRGWKRKKRRGEVREREGSC